MIYPSSWYAMTEFRSTELDVISKYQYELTKKERKKMMDNFRIFTRWSFGIVRYHCLVCIQSSFEAIMPVEKEND